MKRIFRQDIPALRLTRPNRFTTCCLFALTLLCLAAPPVLSAQDRRAEPEGVITSGEALWREEVPRFLNMDPDATFDSPEQWRASDVAVGPDGSTYLMCNIASRDRDNREVQTLLVKYDVRGDREWHHLIDTHIDDFGYTLGVDPQGNVYIAGVRRRQIEPGRFLMHGYITSYNPRGRHRWSLAEDGTHGVVTTRYHDLTFHGDSVYAVGFTSGRVGPGAPFDETPGDAMVTRVRLDGRKQWTRQYQGETNRWQSWGTGIAVTPDGLVCITGIENYVPDIGERRQKKSRGIVVAINGEGEQVWRTTIGEDALPENTPLEAVGGGGIDIAADNAGNLYALGSNSIAPGAETTEAARSVGTYLAKLTDEGRTLWTRYCPNSATSTWTRVRPYEVEVDTQGRVWVAGSVVYRSTMYLGVLQYDADGELVHALRRQAEGYDHDTCYGIAFNQRRGGIVVTGTSKQTAQPRNRRGGDDRRGGRRRGAQEEQAPREPRAPHYYVMRLPLLEDLAEN